MAEKTTAFTGPVVVGLNDKKGEIRLTDGKNPNEAKYLSIAAPDTITSDTTLTFPNGTGTAGQILSTDGSGTLSWVNDSAGNPDGSNGQVQFNDNGTFGAIPDGTSGQVLTSNGAGAAPSFQTATGADPVTSSLDIGTAKTVKINANSPDGNRNVALGRLAFDNSPSGSDNVAIGDEALTGTTSGVQNTAVGSEAMRNSTTNGGNAAFGYQSLLNSIANLNAAFGAGSMRGLTNGIFNTAIGTNCGVNMGGSTDNVLVGGLAGNTLTGGSNNIIVGKSAEPSSPTASNEITLGDANITSLRIPGLQSGASANDVLTFNGTDITLAAGGATDINGLSDAIYDSDQNLGMGDGAVDSITTGTNNIGIGLNAGSGLTSSSYNTFVGSKAGEGMSSFSAENNTAIGYDALSSNNTSGSVAIGARALQTASGINNIGIGNGAGFNLTASSNVFVGQSAGYYAFNSRNNVVVGNQSFNGLNGNLVECTILGYQACTGSNHSGQNNTIIGRGAQPSTTSVSNEVTLGDSSISTLRCNVTSITSLSDARDKKDVEDANIGLDFINDLRPVKFVWDTRDGAKKDIKEVGFIAQELDEVQQKHGVEDHLQLVLKNNPDKLEASQGKLIPILVQAIKDLKKEIDELKKA